jgi:hypothetical protein
MMDTHDAETTRTRARAALREMQDILEHGGGRNWLPGIVAALRALGPEDDASDARASLREAASIYRSMTRGPGSFADFYVQLDDPAEQARANARYGAVADELWLLLGDVR